jgi:hypothetical protein
MTLADPPTGTPPPASNDSAEAADDAGISLLPRRALVRLAVIATVLIFTACAWVLVERGMTVDVPDAMLTARASPAWDGATASVDGVSLARPRTATLDRPSRYTISFHLLPGDYTLTVSRRGEMLFARDVKLTRRENFSVVYLPDSPDKVIDRPATRPDFPSLPFGSDLR